MAVDMFLKIDGIEGDARDSRHKGEIEILSFSWGAITQAPATPAAEGAPVRSSRKSSRS